MLVNCLLLHLHLMKDGLQAAEAKGQNKWVLVDTEQATHSKKPHTMDPLIEIMTNSGKKYEIKTVKSKKKGIDSLTALNLEIADEPDLSGKDSGIPEHIP